MIAPLAKRRLGYTRLSLIPLCLLSILSVVALAQMDFLKSTISLEASLVWRYLDFKGIGTKCVLHRAEGVNLLLNKWMMESRARHWCLSFGPLVATCCDVTISFPLFGLIHATDLSCRLMDLITLPPPALECLFYLSLDFLHTFHARVPSCHATYGCHHSDLLGPQ